MPASPLPSTNAVLTIKVTIDGSPMSDSVAVESVDVTHAINKISVAELVLRGDEIPAEGTFGISDAATFVPGAEVSIAAGYDGTTAAIFKGIVMKHAVEITPGGGSRLRVTCKHKAVKMTFQQAEATFATKKDSEIIQAIVSDHGMSATVTATTQQHAFVFQRVSTDWDFILARAEFNGYVVILTDAGMTVDKPQLSGDAVLRVAAGESMYSFSGEMNAEDQPTGISAYAWDAKTQKNLTATASEPSLNAQGNLTPVSMSSGQKPLKLITSVPLASGDLKTWADGVLLRKRLNAIRSTIKFMGSSLAKVGTLIEIADVGARFNGNAYISSVNHSLKSADWVTTVKTGLEDAPIYTKSGFSYPAATGQVPGIHGLQVGTVKKLSGDPDDENRIQVSIPSNATTAVAVWARFGNFYGSNGVGAGFIPEVNDEVIVGFLDGDPRYPVVLGSLYSSKNVSPNKPADENNYIKSITTKSKLKVTFDDEKKVVKIETPGGNSVTISDEDKGIELKDQNGNSVKLSSSGIDLKSAKDINIKATGGITLDATAKLTLKAAQDVEATGLNVKATAQVGATIKGGATAEISASGQTTIKGGVVMIN